MLSCDRWGKKKSHESIQMLCWNYDLKMGCKYFDETNSKVGRGVFKQPTPTLHLHTALFSLSLLHLLLEALINWHRFYLAPNQIRCLSVSTALPLQCLYSSTAKRKGKVRKSRIFFRYNLHLKSEILVQVKGNKSDAYSNRNDHITRVCHRDTVQNSCTPHKLTTLCL